MTLLIMALSAFRVQLSMLTVFLVKLPHSLTQHTNKNTQSCPHTNTISPETTAISICLFLHNQPYPRGSIYKHG